ncbi:MAG: DUF4232 domain-containing protein [Acidimicrobiales bacterium]
MNRRHPRWLPLVGRNQPGVWLVALVVAAGCSGGGPHSSATVPTTAAAGSTSTLAPGQHPQVVADPSTGLRDGQLIRVTVTGFGGGRKVFLSECASAQAANPGGCGPQLAQQPFLITDDSGSVAGSFTVTASASAKPYDTSALLPCADACVLVATTNIGGGFATAQLGFATGPPRCHTSQLAATDENHQGAAGTLHGDIVLQNTSAQRCTLYGFVGVQRLDASRHAMTTHVARDPSPAPLLVTLDPNQKAAAGYAYCDVFGSTPDAPQAPQPSTYLEVTPPDETDFLVISSAIAPCDAAGTIRMTALQAGGSGAGA